MSQDLRKLFQEERDRKFKMKEGHEERFEALLNQSLPKRRNKGIQRWSIAAGILILLGVTVYFLSLPGSELPENTITVNQDEQEESRNEISLGDLSPDLKQLENYYLANINLELSQLQVSPENKLLVDSYMERLAELNLEYSELIRELNKLGPNDQTITALIQNLQLRLELLYKLKDKLNEIKSSKNEQVTSNSI